MDTNKVNDIEIPDKINNDNDLYDELAHIPEEDFNNNNAPDLPAVETYNAAPELPAVEEETYNTTPVSESGEEYNFDTKMQTNYTIGPELDENDISPEMFDDSEGAWVDAGSEILDTDPVEDDYDLKLVSGEELGVPDVNLNTTPVDEDVNGNSTKADDMMPITRDEGLEKIGEALSDFSNEELLFDGNYEVTADDVKKCVGDSTIASPDFNISEESALEIVKLINKIRENKNFVNKTNIYNEYPKEIRDMIDQYIGTVLGVSPNMKSNQVKQVKNSIAKSLLSEFSSYIEMNSLTKNFNAEMEGIFKEMGTNVSALYKEYNNERENYLKEILSKIPEEDTDKRKIITDTMDAINDSYTLNRLKEGVPKMKKIRKIEMEKPKTRVFADFEAKYRESPYNMYSLDVALDILNKHNVHEDDPNANLRFLIAFCKYCEKYNPNIIPEHSFMFYTVYNIITLDIYKGADFIEFSTEFLKNVNEVIELIKYDK